MKEISELNPHKYMMDGYTYDNIMVLYDCLMILQSECGMDLKITSGLRSVEHQNELISQGKSNAPHSKHLTGEAADIYDPDEKLKEWILQNLEKVELIGLWFEDFSSTKNWVHAQIVAPKSGKRFFIP